MVIVQEKRAIRSINLFPLAKFGAILGGAAMLLPGLMCAGFSVLGLSQLRLLLEEWRGAELDLGLGNVPFDFVTMLGLNTLQATVIQLDEQSMLVALLIVMAAVIGGGTIIGIMIMMLGWLYNILAALTGGIVIELRPKT